MKSRWLIFLSVAIYALMTTSAKADVTHNVWTCWQSDTSNWTMLQPIEHYRSGLYPTWSDCLAWRDGPPTEPYTWSYGLTAPTTVPTSTTSTTVPETSTSTTVEETTTSTTTTTIPETTTTWVTTTESTTTTTTTTTTAPSTTVPVPSTQPWVPPATTTSTTTTTTTTTTTVPETSTSTSTTTSQPETTTSSTTTTSQPKPSTTTSTPTTIPATTSTMAPSTTVPTPAQQVLEVQNLTTQQAVEVFQNLEPQELNEEQISAIVEAVQDAPEEVRQAFEEEVDVFGAGFDDYVPLGSEVPVSTRRTLIAVAVGATMTAVGDRRR